MENYLEKVKLLQLSIKQKLEIRMYKTSMTNTFRDKDLNKKDHIDLSNFNNVININKEYGEVEGSTTFETFVSKSLQENLMPAVVPELKTITIGGAIVGLGIESSSFKYGLVHNNIIEADVILSSGEVMTCSKTINSDLFNALPNSLGSLCYIIKVKMKLVPVKRYVHIHKCWYDNYDHLCKNMEKECLDKTNDFIDAVMFSKNNGVLIIGKMTDEIKNRLSDYKINVYYKSLLFGNNSEDYLTIENYIWRWDTDWFWCNNFIPLIQNYYVRKYIFGDKYLRSDTYKWILYKFRWFTNLFYTKNKESVVQDVIIPVENVTKYLDFLYENIIYGENNEHYVWLCPHYNYSSTLVPSIDHKLYIDIAQWGLFTNKFSDKFYFNKLIEKKCDELNGVKSLYSTVHYDKETFYKKYNNDEYEILKKKYDPNNRIRTMYEKCTK